MSVVAFLNLVGDSSRYSSMQCSVGVVSHSTQTTQLVFVSIKCFDDA